jgi:hypothetical protein
MTQFAGKSFATSWYTSPMSSLIVYTPKRTAGVRWPNCAVIDAQAGGRLADVALYKRVVYHPAVPLSRDEWRALCAYVLVRKHTMLVDDEAPMHFAEKSVGYIDAEHLNLVQMGQGDPFYCGLWSNSQRIRDSVHRSIPSNCSVVIAFRLMNPDDVADLVKIVGPGGQAAATLGEREYLFWRVGMVAPVRMSPLGVGGARRLVAPRTPAASTKKPAAESA